MKLGVLAALFAGFMGQSCVSVQWSRSTLYRKIVEEQVAHMEVGASAMQSALDGLGAPLYVWSLPRDHVALAWGWLGSRDLSVRVTAPTDTTVQPSFEYGQIDTRLRGYVLVFDETQQLRVIEYGYLAELAEKLRRPTLDVERALEYREARGD